MEERRVNTKAAQGDWKEVQRDLEARLEESDRKYQEIMTILNAVPAGIAVIRYDENGNARPEFFSAGFAALTEMTMEEAWELYREDAMNGVHPDDKERLEQELAGYFANNHMSESFIYRLKRGKNSYVTVKNTLTMMESEGGIKRGYAVYQDMTEELEARDKLRHKYQERLVKHYRTVGPDVLLVGHCNISQNSIIEMIDYTHSGLKSIFKENRDIFFKELSCLIPDEKERVDFLQTYLSSTSRSSYEKGQTQLVKSCFMKFPGEARGRYVQFKASLMTDPDTEDLMGTLTVIDVTEKTITRKILQKPSLFGCDFVADVDLLEDWQTMLVINDAEDLSGEKISYSGYLDRALRTYIVLKDREMLREMLNPAYIQNLLKEKDSFSCTYSIQDQNEKILTKKLTISAIDLRIGRVCMARTDITETLEAEKKNQKLLEDALRTAKKANRVKSDFLSSMSHDIRTPMNAIIGMTELAKIHIDDKEKLEDCLYKISLSSKHLLALVNDILDMSKLEQSKLTINAVELVLSDFLEQLSSILLPQAQDAGLAFTIHQHNVMHQRFYADALRLNQILINLIGNAIKFTPSGGKVDLIWEEMLQKESKERVSYRITVMDTGVGMSQEFLEHLFEPFSRSREATYVEGTGLGLSITKGLVDLMNGTIRVQSAKGEGTSFVIELEFEAGSEKEQIHKDQIEKKHPVNNKKLVGKNFLIAEDNPLNAEILCELLQIEGIQTKVKENGFLAVQEFLASCPGTYDAILMDIQMPVMNGYEATRQIRSSHRPDAKTIPIVAMTANAFLEDVQEALSSGMDAHIAKPVDFSILWKTLEKLLND